MIYIAELVCSSLVSFTIIVLATLYEFSMFQVAVVKFVNVDIWTRLVGWLTFLPQVLGSLGTIVVAVCLSTPGNP